MLELNFTKDGAPYSTLYIDKVGQRIGLDTPNGLVWLIATPTEISTLEKMARREQNNAKTD